MNQSATLAVVGGDVRQAYLASLLRADGHTVRTYALERRPVEGCAAVSDPRAGFADVQAVILPLPIQHGDAQLNAPLSNAPHPLADILASRDSGGYACPCRLSPVLGTRPRRAERPAPAGLLIPRRACDTQRGTCFLWL